MLTYSPETAFILTLFELVLSGLPLAVLLWIGFWEPARSPVSGALIVAFALLGAAFAGQAAYDRLAISPAGHVDASYGWLLLVADATRVCSSVGLGAAYLVQNRRRIRLRTFLLIALAIIIVAVVRLPYQSATSLKSIEPLTALRVADVAVLALGAVMLGLSPRLPACALVLLAFGRASALLSAAWPNLTEASWSAGFALQLTGLILLALTLERESKLRLLHHVLRFNLVFVSLAASLVVVLAEISQRQFVEFSVLVIHDVAELARGHLFYRNSLGDSPEQILAQPDVTRQLIREFGRYPDLRRVRLELKGQTMELAINAAGEIDQQSWVGERAEPPPVAPGDFTEALLLRESVVVNGQAVGRVELYHSLVRINTRTGQQMQAAFGVFTLFVIVGSVVTGMLVLVADRTIGRQYRELVEAQRRLSLSERLASIGAVASAVAHEINNPAGVLVARSDYLVSVIRGKAYSIDIQEDVDTIRRQAQRIAKTVKDLLNTAGRMRSAREPVDVAAVVESAIELVQPAVRNRSVTFEFRAASNIVRVWGDRDRLEQVLVNLLSNAAQAIPGRGHVTVTVSLRPGGAWAELVVRDTGAGIKPEDLGRIFDQFFTTKEPGSGWGLGLSIVRRIVQDHGGHIDVQSTPGQGTEFRVSLPAATRQAAEAAQVEGAVDE